MKKNMSLKKIITTALALALSLSLVACGDSGSSSSNNSASTSNNNSSASTSNNNASTTSTDDTEYDDTEYDDIEYDDTEYDDTEYEEEYEGFTVDFDDVAEWIAYGNIGVSTAGELLIWAMNEDFTYGMLTFVPTDDPESPFCVLGEMGIAGDEEGTIAVGYIVDETTGVEMAFAVEPYDDESELISGVFPMGAEFEAICTEMTLEETLEYVQDLCDNYIFVG